MTNIYFSGLQSPYVVESAEPLTLFPLFKYGMNRAWHMDNGDTEIEFTKDDASKLFAEWLDSGNDLMVDYNHESLSGKEGLVKAAGWAKLMMKEDGLYASVEWTPAAYEMLKNKELRYYSPAVQYDDNGFLNHMLPLAVTNTPALKNIPALMNSINTSKNGVNNQSKKETNMSEKLETFSMADMNAMKAELEAVKAEKLAAEERNVDLVVNALLDAAQAEGRLPPAKRSEFAAIAKKTDVETLKLMLSTLSVAITNTKVEASDKNIKVEEPVLSAFDHKIIAERGYTTEQFLAEKRKVSMKLSNASKGSKEETTTVDQSKGKEKAMKLTFFHGIK